MTMTIIDRLRAATGPDRDLDQEIAIIKRSEDTGLKLVGVANCAGYTSSVDAALTLIPEGWGISSLAHFNGKWSCYLSIGDVREPATYRGAAVHAQTLPLAICIAALEARNVPTSPDHA